MTNMEQRIVAEDMLLVSLQGLRNIIPLVRLEDARSRSTFLQTVDKFISQIQVQNRFLALPEVPALTGQIRDVIAASPEHYAELLPLLEQLYRLLDSLAERWVRNPETPDPALVLDAGILLVSGEAGIRNELERVGGDTPIQVYNCSGGDDCRQIMARCRVDVVFLHPQSVGEDVYGICERIKCGNPDLPVYFIHHPEDIHDQIRCLRQGGDGFLAYPFDPVQIFDVLHRATEHRRHRPARVLWIDSDANFVGVFSRILQRSGIQVVAGEDPLDVFSLLYQHRPDLVLLNQEMPAANGIEVCRLLRLNQEFRLLPVLLLASVADPDVRRAALAAGVDEVIFKPLDAMDFVVRLQSLVEKGRLMRGFINRDPLTDLLNHRAFMQQLDHEFNRVERYGGRFCLAVADIDGFAAINDRHSFLRGDQVLLEVARTFRRRFRKTDLLCRFGNDEIGVLCLEAAPETCLEILVGTLDSLKNKVFEGRTFDEVFQVSLSAGVAVYPGSGETPRALVTAALGALDHARTAEPGSVCLADV